MFYSKKEFDKCLVYVKRMQGKGYPLGPYLDGEMVSNDYLGD